MAARYVTNARLGLLNRGVIALGLSISTQAEHHHEHQNNCPHSASPINTLQVARTAHLLFYALRPARFLQTLDRLVIVQHNLQYRVQLDPVGCNTRLAVNMIEEPDAGNRDEFPRPDRLTDRPFERLV